MTRCADRGDMSWEQHGAVLALDEGHTPPGPPPANRSVDRARAGSSGEPRTLSGGREDPRLRRPGRRQKDLRGICHTWGWSSMSTRSCRPSPGGNPGLLLRIRREPVRGSTRRCAAAAADENRVLGRKESPEKLDAYDREMRFEALQANFDTHLTAGEMPPDEHWPSPWRASRSRWTSRVGCNGIRVRDAAAGV